MVLLQLTGYGPASALRVYEIPRRGPPASALLDFRSAPRPVLTFQEPLFNHSRLHFAVREKFGATRLAWILSRHRRAQISGVERLPGAQRGASNPHRHYLHPCVLQATPGKTASIAKDSQVVSLRYYPQPDTAASQTLVPQCVHKRCTQDLTRDGRNKHDTPLSRE